MAKVYNNAPVRVTVEKFSHDGRGIARVDGKTTFIQGALPGELIDFQYLRRKSDFDEAKVVAVISASPQRAEPVCEHYQMCGGCSLQHLDKSAQIDVKQELLLDSLQRIGHVQPQVVLPALAGPSWAYRYKARLSVRYVEKKQRALVGFREKNSPRYIAEISQCAVLNSSVSSEIENLRHLIEQFNDRHCIAQIEVAAGDDLIALIFRNLSPLTDGDQRLLQDFSTRTGFHVYLQPGNAQTVHLLYPPDAPDYLHYELPDESLIYRFKPTDFTQINPELNRLMVGHAMELLDLNSEDIVLDLFCGLGNFSLPIARRCAKVVGVEGSVAMVLRAQMNAQDNSLSNTEFFSADLDKKDALQILSDYKFTKLLIDPPRSGALEIVENIGKLNPSRIVYVSCNPATLARDSAVLVAQGYCLVSAGVMDMFPHTAHVESIAVFQRG